MIKIIITGQPGTGKSELFRCLKRNEVPILKIDRDNAIDLSTIDKCDTFFDTDVIICEPDRIPEITAEFENTAFIIGEIEKTDIGDIPSISDNETAYQTYEAARKEKEEQFAAFEKEMAEFHETQKVPENGKYLKGNIRATFSLNNDYTQKALGIMTSTIMCMINRLKNLTHVINCLNEIGVIDFAPYPANECAVEVAFSETGVSRLMSDYLDTYQITKDKAVILKRVDDNKTE